MITGILTPETLSYRSYLPMFLFVRRVPESRLQPNADTAVVPMPAPTPESTGEGAVVTVTVPLLTPATAPEEADRSHRSYLPLFLRVHRFQAAQAP